MYTIRMSPLILLTALMGASAQPATQIKVYQAYISENVLNPNLVVSQRFQGVCKLKSFAESARPDTWRCQTNSIILDPCFHDGATLACLATPWSNRATIIEPNQSLPKTTQQSPPNTAALPWGIDLANGQRCTFLTGNSTIVNQMRTNYACTNYNYSIVGNIDRSTPTWHATMYDAQKGAVEKVAIRTVWF